MASTATTTTAATAATTTAAAATTEAASAYNFGPASGRDELAYGSCRPGLQSNKDTSPGAVKDSEVAEWVAQMKAWGIQRVVSLLGDDELEWYENNLDEQMKAAGFSGYARTSVFAPDAHKVIEAALREAGEAKEKVVVHCSGGGGRAALGLGQWLTSQHELTPEQAADEIAEFAKDKPFNRRPDAAKLTTLQTAGTLAKAAAPAAPAPAT